MIVIKDKQDIDINKINVKKPYVIENKSYFNIFYEDNLIFIQTPLCFLPFNYNLYDNRYFQLDLNIIEDDIKFIELLNSILQFIYNKVKKKYNNIKKLDNGSYRIRLKNNNHDTIHAFDINKQLIDLRNISKGDRVKCIFQIEKVILINNDASINLKIIQIQKIDKSIDIFKTPILFKGSPPPPPPLPPPPPPIFFSKGLIINKKDTVIISKNKTQIPSLEDILSSKNKLKKPEIKPPSLEEILSSKNKLKKPDRLNYLVL
jgi:hypothetical protein